jgi:hypothetical protein
MGFIDDETGACPMSDQVSAVRASVRETLRSVADHEVSDRAAFNSLWPIVDAALRAVPLSAETERDDWHPQGLDEARRMHASELCKRMPETQQRWRRLLFGAWAMRDGSQNVYCDDGEMQFNAWPMIDFLRDPLDVIERKIAEHGERRLREAMSAPAVSREASVPLPPAASGGTQEFTAAEVEAWIEEESRYLNERTLAMLRAYARLLSPPAFINNEHGEKLNSAPSPAPTGAEGPAKTWFDECEENR